MPLPLKNLANCLLAGAAGDCIGGPFEGRKDCVAQVPEGSWEISDDTILTLATAKALLETGTVDPAAIAASLSHEFATNGIPGLGASTLKALRDLKAGAHWALSGRRGEHAAGNGAAMRIAPLAFFLDADDPDHRRTIRDVCRITHHNDEAYVAALAILTAMQLGADVNFPLAWIAGKLPDTKVRDTLLTLSENSRDLTPLQAAAITGNSGYAPESIPLAIFIALSATDLESGILAAVGCGGDTDTIASMVGQILGARGHLLPDEWLAKIPGKAAILDICTGLGYSD